MTLLRRDVYLTVTSLVVAILISISIAYGQSGTDSTRNSMTEDEKAIRKIQQQYVAAWKAMDKEGILSLFEDNARIQPNSLAPIEGKANISKFWFPEDGSETIISSFDTEILSVSIKDSIAISTQTSLLDWTYKKDTVQFGRIQRGIRTAVYRKQPDNSWKIWRMMWTDIYSENK